MWQKVDRRFPWIELARLPEGMAVVRDTRTGEEATVRDQAALAQFVAAHSAAPGHAGLGDLVRGFTKWIGFGECTPCAKRQAAMNRLAPRVFRR